MKSKIKIISSISICLLFILFAFGSGKSNSKSRSKGPEIENEQGIRDYIKGKWSTSFYELGTTWYYRFEITDSEIIYWTKFGEWDWIAESERVHTYTLGRVRPDTYGHKFRSLDFEGEDLGLRRGNYLLYDNNCLQFNGSCLEKGWK
jgi:hypothetical protein